MKILEINKEKIALNPTFERFQAKADKAEFRKSIAELANNIASIGLQQPLIVVPVKDSEFDYMAISGNRRLLACRMLKEFKDIPCIIGEGDEFEIAISTNIQTLEMSDIEKGSWLNHQIETLKDQKPWSDNKKPVESILEHFGKRLGRAPRTLRTWINSATEPADNTPEGASKKKGRKAAGRKKGTMSREEKVKNARKVFFTLSKKLVEKLAVIGREKQEFIPDKQFMKVYEKFASLVSDTLEALKG